MANSTTARNRMHAERRRAAAVRRRRIAGVRRVARSAAAALIVTTGAFGVVHTLDGAGHSSGVAHPALSR